MCTLNDHLQLPRPRPQPSRIELATEQNVTLGSARCNLLPQREHESCSRRASPEIVAGRGIHNARSMLKPDTGINKDRHVHLEATLRHAIKQIEASLDPDDLCCTRSGAVESQAGRNPLLWLVMAPACDASYALHDLDPATSQLCPKIETDQDTPWQPRSDTAFTVSSSKHADVIAGGDEQQTRCNVHQTGNLLFLQLMWMSHASSISLE